VKEKVGVKYSKGPTWEPYKLEDRNLITGQNPRSAIVLAERLLEILGSR
jgi:putative intracellular protease/amidase